MLLCVCGLGGHEDRARRQAEFCLEVTPVDNLFHVVYAYEALARAERVTGNAAVVSVHLAGAVRHAEATRDAAAKKLVVDDPQSRR